MLLSRKMALYIIVISLALIVPTAHAQETYPVDISNVVRAHTGFSFTVEISNGTDSILITYTLASYKYYAVFQQYDFLFLVNTTVSNTEIGSVAYAHRQFYLSPLVEVPDLMPFLFDNNRHVSAVTALVGVLLSEGFNVTLDQSDQTYKVNDKTFHVVTINGVSDDMTVKYIVAPKIGMVLYEEYQTKNEGTSIIKVTDINISEPSEFPVLPTLIVARIASVAVLGFLYLRAVKKS